MAVRTSAPDLLVLDVDMPDLDGFGVLDAIEDGVQPYTVVTAYDEFAVRAFEKDALDYLVEPFTDERFRKALERVRRRLSLAFDAGADRPVHLEHIPVTVGRRTRWIDVAAVLWIAADDYYARLHTVAGVYLVRRSLATLERRLDPGTFARVHRGALVNRAAVRSLIRTRGDAHVMVLTSGEQVLVSERRLRTVVD